MLSDTAVTALICLSSASLVLFSRYGRSFRGSLCFLSLVLDASASMAQDDRYTYLHISDAAVQHLGIDDGDDWAVELPDEGALMSLSNHASS